MVHTFVIQNMTSGPEPWMSSLSGWKGGIHLVLEWSAGLGRPASWAIMGAQVSYHQGRWNCGIVFGLCPFLLFHSCSLWIFSPWSGQLRPWTFFFFFLVSPRGMQDLSSLTRDWTCAPCSGSVASSPLEHQGSPLGQMFLQRWMAWPLWQPRAAAAAIPWLEFSW